VVFDSGDGVGKLGKHHFPSSLRFFSSPYTYTDYRKYQIVPIAEELSVVFGLGSVRIGAQFWVAGESFDQSRTHLWLENHKHVNATKRHFPTQNVDALVQTLETVCLFGDHVTSKSNDLFYLSWRTQTLDKITESWRWTFY
jgi:hypothetical protein